MDKKDLSITAKDFVNLLDQADDFIVGMIPDDEIGTTKLLVRATCMAHSMKIMELLMENVKNEQDQRTEKAN